MTAGHTPLRHALHPGQTYRYVVDEHFGVIRCHQYHPRVFQMVYLVDVVLRVDTGEVGAL